jgi:hypothetical protein
MHMSVTLCICTLHYAYVRYTMPVTLCICPLHYAYVRYIISQLLWICPLDYVSITLNTSRHRNVRYFVCARYIMHAHYFESSITSVTLPMCPLHYVYVRYTMYMSVTLCICPLHYVYVRYTSYMSFTLCVCPLHTLYVRYTLYARPLHFVFVSNVLQVSKNLALRRENL